MDQMDYGAVLPPSLMVFIVGCTRQIYQDLFPPTQYFRNIFERASLSFKCDTHTSSSSRFEDVDDVRSKMRGCSDCYEALQCFRAAAVLLPFVLVYAVSAERGRGRRN